jgi:hypothetical protein
VAADDARASAISPTATQIHAILPDSRKSTAGKTAPSKAAAPVKTKSASIKKKPAVAPAAPAPVAASEPVEPEPEPEPEPVPVASDDDETPDEPPAAEPVPQQRSKPMVSSPSKAGLKKKPNAAATNAAPASPSKSSLATANFDFAAHSNLSALQDAHRALTAQLAQREAENAQMADALLTLQEELTAAEVSGGAALTKDLARKNREAAVLLAKERARYEKQIDTLKKEHAKALEEAQAGMSSSAAGRGPPSPKRAGSTFAFGSTARDLPSVSGGGGSSGDDSGSLEHRFAALQATQATLQKQYLDKCTEVTSAQSKMKLLARALVREVDEGGAFKPDQVLDETYLNKFKGRAQKITLLQSKVRELEKQLRAANAAAADDGATHGPGPSREHDRFSATSSLSHHHPPDAQDVQESALAKMASDRKADVASLRLDLSAAREEADSLRRKADAARARRSTLETEVRALKESVKSLFDKSAEDDKLIDALRAELERSKKEQATAQSSAAASKRSSSTDGESGARGRSSSLQAAASGSGAAAAAAVRGDYNATKLAEQEKLIASLREQLRRVQASASPELATRLRAYADAEESTQLQLARVENDKYKEMVALHAQRIGELEAQLLQAQRSKGGAAAASSNASSAAAAAPPPSKSRPSLTATGRGGGAFPSRPAASSSGTAAAPAAAAQVEVSTLKSQLQSALSEQELIRTSYANTLANKEQDIQLLHAIIDQKQAAYQASIQDMRQKFAAVTASLR